MKRLLFLLALAVLPTCAVAVTGAVDRTFGDNGLVYTDFGGYELGTTLAIEFQARVQAVIAQGCA